VTRRLVLVEGPDDVSALIELGQRMFKTAPHKSAGPATRGLQRDARLILARTTEIELRSAPNAKDGIPIALVKAFQSFPVQIAGDESHSERVAFFYDPDKDPPGAFNNKVDQALQALSIGATPWTVTREAKGDRWTLVRAGEAAISLRGIAWHGDGPVLDGLDNLQNLERLLCRVMGATYPEQETLVARWLDEIRTARLALDAKATKPPKWKAAVLLWAALVDESATSDAGIASRFLGQHKPPGVDDFHATSVAPQIQASSLEEPLGWVFGN